MNLRESHQNQLPTHFVNMMRHIATRTQTGMFGRGRISQPARTLRRVESDGSYLIEGSGPRMRDDKSVYGGSH